MEKIGKQSYFHACINSTLQGFLYSKMATTLMYDTKEKTYSILSETNLVTLTMYDQSPPKKLF